MPRARPFTTEEQRKIHRMLDRGLNCSEIALILDRDTSSVIKQARQLGWIPAGRGKKIYSTLPKRKCLTHGGLFTPEHRYEFMCKACKARM